MKERTDLLKAGKTLRALLVARGQARQRGWLILLVTSQLGSLIQLPVALADAVSNPGLGSMPPSSAAAPSANSGSPTIPDIKDGSPFCAPPIETLSASGLHFITDNHQHGQNWTAAPDLPKGETPLSPSLAASLDKTWTFAHQMNQVYIHSIALAISPRWTLAQHLGLDTSTLAAGRAEAAQSCAQKDPAGRDFQNEFREIDQALQGKVKRLSAAQVNAYVTHTALALLEYARLQKVFQAGSKRYRRMAENDPQRAAVASAAREALLRLLILRERFPILQNSGWSKSSGMALVQLVDNSILSRWGSVAVNEAYYGEPSLDALFGYNAIHHEPGSPPGEALINQLGFMSPTQDLRARLYPRLYHEYLTGVEQLPSTITSSILDAVTLSLQQSLKSVAMKCEASPCTTFGLQPTLTSTLAVREGLIQDVRPFACACRIGHDQTTVSNAVNLGIAAVGGGLTVACVLNPEFAPVCYSALVSTFVDVGSGVAGIYDAEVNRRAFLRLSGGQTDAVDPLTSYRGETDSKRAEFEYEFNWITNLLSFIPSRMAKQPGIRLAQIPMALLNNHVLQETTAVETIKAASALPPPELYVDGSTAIQSDQN